MGDKNRWGVCDQGICLISHKCSRERCIRHGSLVDYRPSLDGLTREQARARLKQQQREQ